MKLIAPFAAGGLSDLTARVAADCFEQQTGEQFIVENQDGGGGVVGATEMVQSEPDGYTLAVTTLSVSVLVPLVTEGSGCAVGNESSAHQRSRSEGSDRADREQKGRADEHCCVCEVRARCDR